MQGVYLFLQAIHSVLWRWKDALRIVALPILALVALNWFLLLRESEGLWPELTYLAANLVVISIVAVNWHRLVLLQESPHSLAPRLHGLVMLRYLFAWFVLGVVLALILFFVGAMLLLAIRTFSPQMIDSGILRELVVGRYATLTGAVFVICVIWAFMYMLFRLGLRLPSVAVGQQTIGLDASRVLTKPHRGALLAVAAFAAIAQLAIVVWETLLIKEEVTPYLTDLFLIELGYMAVAMFGTSLLTEIYRAIMPEIGAAAR